MHIDYLADHPHLIPQLAKFHFAEWSCLHPGETLEQRTSRLAASCGRNTIPAVLVAIAENGEPLGSLPLFA